jgi:hypothetical protein
VEEYKKWHYLLLSAGSKGCELWESWKISESDRKVSANVFNKFKEHLISTPNKWVSRLNFASLHQNECWKARLPSCVLALGTLRSLWSIERVSDRVIGVLRLHPTRSGDTGARTEGPGPGFPPTLIDKSQGFFILHTTIDSSTQRPALLRSWAALQSHRRITIVIHNHNARGLIGSRTRDLDPHGRHRIVVSGLTHCAIRCSFGRLSGACVQENKKLGYCIDSE